MADRMPRFPGDVGSDTEFPIFKERDVSDAASKLRRGGSPRSFEGKVRHVQNTADMSKVAQSLGSNPPMTGDMLGHSSDYNEYMNHAVEGRPMSKNAYYGGGVSGGMSGSIQGGIPSMADPLNSPTRWNIPTWDEKMPFNEKEQLQQEARGWCDWYYHNHPIVPICLDIYSKYPFVGMDIGCPDPGVEEVYREMFFDRLDYPSFLPFAALQFWKYGEAGILGEWDGAYGGWLDDEVIESDQLSVMPWYRPGKNKETYLWYPPQEMLDIIENQDELDPRLPWMIDEFGDQLWDWAEGHPSELSPDVFSLLRNNKDINGTRGYPLLMRAFGTLMKEEKLNQAVNAIADRLYTPLMVVKLGSRDMLQGKYQWIPSPEQMKAMQAHLEMMMVSRYRMMVYHAGIEFENPFAGQQIPDLSKDYERATKEIMGVFGIPQELIYGGSQGTYASGALSAEIMMQNLATTQQMWSRWMITKRASKVAEAQGFYEVERKGSIYTKPLERVVEYDENGKKHIRDRRRLMLPNIRFQTMDMNTEEAKVKGLSDLRRQFNIPISNKRLVSSYDTDLNLDEEAEVWMQEQIDQFERTQKLGPAAPPVPGAAPGGMGGGLPTGAPGMGRPRPGGGRPPVSDNARGDMPTPPGQPTPGEGVANGDPEPVITSLRKEEDIRYLTTSDELSTSDMNDWEKIKMSSKLEGMDREDIEEMIRKTSQYKSMKKQSSYADEHSFTFVRKKGSKTGVTYFMQGNTLRMSPSD